MVAGDSSTEYESAIQTLTQFAYSHVSSGESSSTSIVPQQTSSLNADFRGFLLELLRENHKLKPVSYTHLTLPTNREV